MEQTAAGRPRPSLSSTGSPISGTRQSILPPPRGRDTCPSVLPVIPPACCCEKRRTSASPPVPAVLRHTKHSPRQEEAHRGKAIRRTAGDALARTNSSEPAGNPWTHAYGKNARAPGVHLPRHGSFGFNLGQGEGSCARGHDRPSLHLPAGQRRAGSAQVPLCKTSRS